MSAPTLLYGDPSPSLRWRTAIEIDGASGDDEDVTAWRGEIDASEGVRALVAQLVATSHPQTAGYLLCRLAYLGYRGPQLAGAVESILAHQQPDGSWPLLADDEVDDPPVRKSRNKAGPKAPAEGPRFVTMQTALPLRGIAAAGFATDPRAERAYEFLLSERLPDGSWPSGPKADLGGPGRPSLPERDYRRLTRGEGCRSATTGVVACFTLHPERARSDEAHVGVDHLLARETRDDAALGWEVARLVGLERAMGRITFYATFDPAFVLDLASRCGVAASHRRVRDLVSHLEGLRGPYGLWEHHTHPQLSGWLTFDLECSLRRLAEGDWVGDEEPATFTPYKRRPRRS